MRTKLLSAIAALPLAATAMFAGAESAKAQTTLTFNTPPAGGDQLDLALRVNANLTFLEPGNSRLFVDFFNPDSICGDNYSGLFNGNGPGQNCVLMGPATTDADPVGPDAGFFGPMDDRIAEIVNGIEINLDASRDLGGLKFLLYDPIQDIQVPPEAPGVADIFYADTALQPILTDVGDDLLFEIQVLGRIIDETNTTYNSRIAFQALLLNTNRDELEAQLIECFQNGTVPCISTALDAEQDLAVNVPEPSAMLGLAAVLGAGFFAKKRKDS